jgi:protease-4
VVQSAIAHTYTQFTGYAAKARKTTPDKIDAVAQGRVWTGTQALERGLVDRTGSFGDALESAAKRAKLEPGYRVAYIEREPGKFTRLLELLGVDGQAFAPLAREAGQAARQVSRQVAGPAAALADAALPGWQAEFGWLADVVERRKPFDAVVHCLCTPP